MSEGYTFRIEHRPDYGFLDVTIPAGCSLKVEASAMATMDTNLRMTTRAKGGVSRLLTGESLFVNEFRAEGGPGRIGIAPATPGDVEHLGLSDGETVFLQSSAYLASAPAVALESKWQGMVRGFFSGESLFLIRAKGPGDLWFNTYGALIPVDVDGAYVVDTGHIAAFTGSLDYEVGMLGGYKSLFFSGEGLVCRFKGKGRLWIQTRKVPPFAWWVDVFRRRKAGN